MGTRDCQPSAGEVRTAAVFTTTDWQVVLAAKQASSPDATEALEALCLTYWPPLYAFARGRGYTSEQAQDLTQEFFSRFVGKNYLKSVEQEKGRFRSFLLACMKHFLADDWDKTQAIKRGGRVEFLSWDRGVAESQIEQDLGLAMPPDQLYTRRWALTVLAVVEERLRGHYRETGKQELYTRLDQYLNGDPEKGTYAEIGQGLGMTGEAVRKSLERMRLRYTKLLREEIGRTVELPSEIDQEIQELRMALSG